MPYSLHEFLMRHGSKLWAAFFIWVLCTLGLVTIMAGAITMEYFSKPCG